MYYINKKKNNTRIKKILKIKIFLLMLLSSRLKQNIELRKSKKKTNIIEKWLNQERRKTNLLNDKNPIYELERDGNYLGDDERSGMTKRLRQHTNELKITHNQ